MGFLGGLFKSAVDIVTLPVAVVVDVATLGEAGATDRVIENTKDDLESVIDGDVV